MPVLDHHWHRNIGLRASCLNYFNKKLHFKEISWIAKKNDTAGFPCSFKPQKCRNQQKTLCNATATFIWLCLMMAAIRTQDSDYFNLDDPL
ncbi:hypothetical protein GDO81_012049 [Engystomops pustulosus]|uniref:Uncharacterized protein n=1 Tax=Engystomops pustulosus TaxID=76066 RepID=A0AAV7BIK9_ENGPU|nr:hypothetical protein GDO81_012049 [Engystomops pustulosus]